MLDPSFADSLAALVDEIGFSGAVRVDVGDRTALAEAFGLADRRHGIANTMATRFGIASGVKGWTALVIANLAERGVLSFDAPVRRWLGSDLPLIDDRVTVEQLLAHRSGIGDYLDESAGGSIVDHVLAVPVHRLATTEDYLTVVDGHPQVSPPGSDFRYNNSGYVVLALVAERAAATPFHTLVGDVVCRPAALTSTGFLRSDELPGDAAVGYLSPTGLRTNALHLPVLGSGDGGLYSTVDDVHRLWLALDEGRIVAADMRDRLWTPLSTTESGSARYGLGFWLDADGPGVWLEGYDAGVSFKSLHDPSRRITWTVVSNTSSGAWPIAKLLDRLRAA